MRLALFVHCYFPEHFYGTEAYTRALAREFQALGHEPTVVTAVFAGERRQGQLIEAYEVDGIPVVRIDRNVYPNQRIRDTFDFPYLRFVFERVLRKLKPDVVHIAHLINHTSALFDVTRVLGIPTFATLTDFFGLCFNNKLENASGLLCAGPNETRSNCVECAMVAMRAQDATIRLASKPGLRPAVAALVARRPSLAGSWKADVEALVDRPDHLRRAMANLTAAIAPSRFLRNAYLEGGFSPPLELSWFGIDIDRSPKPARHGNEIRIGFIGQLAAHKGVHLLLQAFRTAARDRLRLEIWGDEAQSPDYAAKLRALAAGQKVAFKGTFPLERLSAILAEIDVLVIPSTWHENAPLILLQALATHTPLIVSDVDGLTEFITPDLSGVVVPKGDVQALAETLRGFADHPDRAAWMSERTRYERNSRAMAQDVLDLYARHLGRDADFPIVPTRIADRIAPAGPVAAGPLLAHGAAPL